ncbi:AbrB/MazE/SpoVT family DNA-binding domain-containing protein [Catellatospora vulcania]|uniref:AbrB/MazE/SpoVT family DNA-binding domain-containing protein n=1 Tax=Catellatospora vulcania TaxID=1460450 RepID=UPI0012D3EA79|nr:AbrB/MazE/SpoVT family DNA-binding domain-containing protein [Catellatospora vulcania]
MSDVQHDQDSDRSRAGAKRAERRAARNRGLTATLRAKGGVTIPQAVRDQLQLEEGDQVIVSVRDGSIVLTPAALVPRDQEWFHLPQWQAREAEADADLAAGRFTRYGSDEEFLASLDGA